jgi:hypothetical protein
MRFPKKKNIVGMWETRSIVGIFFVDRQIMVGAIAIPTKNVMKNLLRSLEKPHILLEFGNFLLLKSTILFGDCTLPGQQ